MIAYPTSGSKKKKNNLDQFEGYYASVVYAFFQGLGLEVKAENYTNKGRIDLVITYNDKVYILEFKVLKKGEKQQKASEALKQKDYVDKYKAKAKELYLVGIDFSTEIRNISNFDWEKVK